MKSDGGCDANLVSLMDFGFSGSFYRSLVYLNSSSIMNYLMLQIFLSLQFGKLTWLGLLQRTWVVTPARHIEKNVDQIYMLSWRVSYDSSVITSRKHDAA